jgi:predicted SAM-dependent methyltransferase
MRETSKCQRMRKDRGDFNEFLKGNGIDIGCGDDCLKVESGAVRPWDVKDGDAQLMTGVPDGELDFVYSSHCMEHIRDVRETLTNWIRILKPGGHLYIVVPDYILYEKMTWPSMFNPDHKQSFSVIVQRRTVMRPNHFHIATDLVPLLNELNADLVRVTLEDRGYNYNAGMLDQTLAGALSQLCIVAKKRAAV